jgi:hypothetical protein
MGTGELERTGVLDVEGRLEEDVAGLEVERSRRACESVVRVLPSYCLGIVASSCARRARRCASRC